MQRDFLYNIALEINLENYLEFNKSLIHVEDRGYQFADGVYEVINVLNGIGNYSIIS